LLPIPLHTVLQAAKGGLKALQQLGVWGVVVNIWWGQVEAAPQQYDWAQYQALFQVAREVGLRVKVSFCFHGDDKHTLPAWVLEEGKQCPDMFFTDRGGCRNTECLSVGVDHGEQQLLANGACSAQDFETRMQMACAQIFLVLERQHRIGHSNACVLIQH
jgi:hypothetical protein